MKNILLTVAATAALLIGGLMTPSTADARPWGYRGYGYRPYYGGYARPYYYGGYGGYYRPNYGYRTYSYSWVR